MICDINLFKNIVAKLSTLCNVLTIFIIPIIVIGIVYIRKDKHQNTTEKLVFPRQHKDNSLKMPTQTTQNSVKEFLSVSENEIFFLGNLKTLAFVEIS